MTSEEPLDCVVDASVGVKLFLDHPLSDEAHGLFTCLASDPPTHLFVPDLFYIECTNIFWKYVQRWELSPEEAHLFVEQLGQLALRSSPTAAVMSDAVEIALAYGITAYDAAYVALAQQLALPLITADARLARAMDGTAHDIRWLGDLATLSA